MKQLCLRPLPVHRADENATSLKMERESFVDEARVTALVTGCHLGRSVPYPADLALAADDLDFAGWRLSAAETPRCPEVPPHVIDAIVRRTLPQIIGESGRGSSQTQSRWYWLTGIAGVLSTLLFIVMWLSAPAHLPTHFKKFLSPTLITTAKPDPLQNAAKTTRDQN